jgi:serine/threonine-protein kinase
MSQEKPEGDSDERLGELIATYLRATETGRPFDRKQFIAQHPELGSELDLFFSNHDDAERLSRPLRELASAGQADWKGHVFGDYEILGEIGRGGMGVIYRARQRGLNRTVALKMIRAGKLAAEEDVERFRTEAKAAASLSHPNIVPIYDFGEHEGQQYFTMELIQGRTLDRHEHDFRSDPREAARLLAIVARAVHHAHQRRIIHRDLKPANILIDDAGRPHITDFGLAKQAGIGRRLTESNVILGTLAYIGPERLSDDFQPLTTSVDLWSLGVMLYELITGKEPFRGKNQMDTLERIRKQDPAPPRTLNRDIPRDLEAICLKCLEKEPERRYGSALGLARDLERFLKREPIEARPVHRVVRAWSWCRRNPGAAGLVVAGGVLVLAATLGTVFRMAENAAREDAVEKGLVYTAKLVAHLVRHRIEQWGQTVQETSGNAELRKILADWNRFADRNPGEDREKLIPAEEGRRLQRYCESLHQASLREPAFENWHLLDREGTLVARTPYEPKILGKNFRERDYFQGLLRHMKSAKSGSPHLSGGFRSVSDDHYKFDICWPVLGEDGEFLGVVAIAIGVHSTLGLHDLHDTARKVILVAPWDSNRRPNDPVLTQKPADHLLFVHPGYRKSGEDAVGIDIPELSIIGVRTCGVELSLPDAGTRSIALRDYVDPFSKRDPTYAGRWMAGLASVGNSGFVVIVQQKAE